MLPRHSHWLAATTTILLAAFVALELHAMAVYPGGSWRDHRTVGYLPWENFFCDLSSDIAVNGQPHPGALHGKLAMMLFGAALLPMWWLGSRLGRDTRLVRATWLCGCAGSCFAQGVPWTPFGPLHSIVSLLAGGCGLLAVLGILSFAFRAGRTSVWLLGLFALLSGGIVAVVYLAVILCGMAPLLLPGAQKIACALLMAWVLVTVWQRPDR